MRRPPHPYPPPRPQGYLLQKIVACERRSIAYLSADLCVETRACPPVTLQSLQYSGAPVSNTPPDACGRLTISIPLCAQLCDSHGRLHSGSAVLAVETDLPRSFAPCSGHSLFILPCVQLLRAEPCPEDFRFRVQLAISLEIYLLRYEPCFPCPPKPSCPQLPLYPPPIRPH